MSFGKVSAFSLVNKADE
jgi:hypothetical protein